MQDFGPNPDVKARFLARRHFERLYIVFPCVSRRAPSQKIRPHMLLESTCRDSLELGDVVQVMAGHGFHDRTEGHGAAFRVGDEF
jgi:hypothetical protein